MTDIETLLQQTERRVAMSAREVTRQQIADFAADYDRTGAHSKILESFLHTQPDFFKSAMSDQSDPRITWHIIRVLCHHIRWHWSSPLGSPTRIRLARRLAAGELLLLHRQRAYIAACRRHIEQPRGLFDGWA